MTEPLGDHDGTADHVLIQSEPLKPQNGQDGSPEGPSHSATNRRDNASQSKSPKLDRSSSPRSTQSTMLARATGQGTSTKSHSSLSQKKGRSEPSTKVMERQSGDSSGGRLAEAQTIPSGNESEASEEEHSERDKKHLTAKSFFRKFNEQGQTCLAMSEGRACPRRAQERVNAEGTVPSFSGAPPITFPGPGIARRTL